MKSSESELSLTQMLARYALVNGRTSWHGQLNLYTKEYGYDYDKLCLWL